MFSLVSENPSLLSSLVSSRHPAPHPPTPPSSALIRLFSTGLMGSVCLQRLEHGFSFLHKGCFLRACRCCFHLPDDIDASELWLNKIWPKNSLFLFFFVEDGNDRFGICVSPVCRYACHRKCCQRMTTKCSKKVSWPYCLYTQWYVS